MTSYTGLRLEPVTAIGVNFLDNGTVHWNGSRQFFYPVGAHIRHYHLETNQTQFLFPERFTSNCAEVIKVCDLAVSTNFQFIAISEVFRPTFGVLSIYDTETQVAHVHLRHADIRKFSSICFSYDGSMIAAFGVGPESTRVVIWKMGRQVSLAAVFPVPPTTKEIAFDPQDSYRLLLFGSNFVSTILINTIDKIQKPIEITDFKTFNHFCFVSAIPGLLLVTSGKYLVVIMNDEVVSVKNYMNMEIELLKTIRNWVFIISKGMIHFLKADFDPPFISYLGEIDIHAKSITEFSPSPDGDLAVIFHDDSFVGLFDINVSLKILKQQNEAKENEKMLLDKDQENEINEFLKSQSTISEQIPSNLVDKTEIQQFIGLFSPLSIRYHVGSIVAIATCPRKPLLATCGSDKSLLVWNLAKKCVIASVKLNEPVNNCSFHPSGDLLAVGTSERLLLYSLTFDSLVLRAKWESLSCTCVKFSNGGHLLAAGSLIIKVISTYSAKSVTSLRGHNLSVKSIEWAQNDAYFVSSGLDGNVFKWSAKTWERTCMITLTSQCIAALLSPSSIYEEESNKLVPSSNVLVVTSNNTIYDLEMKTERLPKRKLTITSIALPVHFSLVSGDQRGDLQVIPYPLLPAGDDTPFHIGIENSVHTMPVHCIVASIDGQTLFTASEDSSVFVFNIVQPHQMVVAAPVSIALSREEQSFLIEKESFEEKQDAMLRLREMLNLHRSQFQCAKTKLSEQQSREVVQQKNKWQMALSALKKQVNAIITQKIEQEKKAGEVIADSDTQHIIKIKNVKEMYEAKLTEQTRTAATLMKEKVSVQCDYEDRLHQMTETFKDKLLEKRESAQKNLEVQAVDNVNAEKEYKQIERLQSEEKVVLEQEHKMEMEQFQEEFEQQISKLNNEIEGIRTEIVGLQDIHDGNVEQTANLDTAKRKLNSENRSLEKQKQVCHIQINQLKTELASRGDRVARQTNNLISLKTRNDELQKWRAVMDYRSTELKSQVEPKAHKIEGLRSKIIDNEISLRKLKQSNLKDTAEHEVMEQEINDLYNEILKAENQSQKCEATINQFKNKVHAIYTEVEPEHWVTEITKLHKEFITRKVVVEENKALDDTLTEFERHKEALADKIVVLREGVESNTKSSGNSFLKQIDNNEDFMLELGRLRIENKRLKSDLHLAQTELNSLLRQCARESPSLETKVKTMFRSTNIICQPVIQHIQKRTTRSGASVTVEHFT
ncbi:hypothetical protein TRFO_05719 [Tritrichomonas foetus]|uniref:WD repeat protein n=1 Tax=Tritrichomonas foetus TaxID=1144522 RepID=A0A1J4K3V3_9EUKA|nr:hypothetical protein TRFO_05719 [Tritrichomonas foetus]|eukprot:OHT06063.1 hypothetical protein TRFO_05719 [Tritrichomonas foetus]